jgi:hypothetical protein
MAPSPDTLKFGIVLDWLRRLKATQRPPPTSIALSMMRSNSSGIFAFMALAYAVSTLFVGLCGP